MTEAMREPNDVELGWLVLGHLDDVDRQAIGDARDAVSKELQRQFGDLDWQMPVHERRDLDLHRKDRQEPSSLLEHGIDERDTHHFDLVLVLTDADLLAHGKRPYSLGVSSRSTGVGVLSTARLDPIAQGRQEGEEERSEAIARRLGSLALHIIGDLLGAAHDRQPGSAMVAIESIEPLDHIEGFTPQTVASVEPELRRIADRRLEETRRPPRRAWFYVKAAMMNAATIWSACWRAKPWQLPVRLGRLSTAAISALVVLMLTAESWELAMHVSAPVVPALSLLCLLATAAYAVWRQQLLMSRASARLTEQIAVASISAVVTVGTGLLVAYALLFGLAALIAVVVFPTELIADWANVADIGTWDYGRVGGIAASFGLIVGALGASFESHHYFRHVTYVDEELG